MNDKNQILLQRRSDNLRIHPGKWTISMMSHVECGESQIECLIRECKEELGINIRLREPFFLFSIKNQSIRNNNQYVNNEFNQIYLVKKDIDIKDIRMYDHEVSEVKWVDLYTLKKWSSSKKEDLVIYDEEFKKVFRYIEKRM